MRRKTGKGDNRRAGSFGTEAWKRLSAVAFHKTCQREHFRRRHDTLAAAAVDANLKHSIPSKKQRRSLSHKGLTALGDQRSMLQLHWSARQIGAV